MKQTANILDSMYEEIRLIKETARKKIILLKNKSTGDYSVAKIQFRQQQNNQERTVRHEGKFFLEMQGHIGIPLMRWVGKDGLYDVLIIQKLGQTLLQLFKRCNKKFSLKTIAMIGIRMLKIIQNYHQKGFIHKNLTPKDFQFGISDKNTVLYLNDLMDSQTYINKKNNKHMDNKSNIRITSAGLNMFMSIEQMRGEQPSRRNDIEAIIMMMIYFSLGQLPWENIIYQDITLDNKVKKINKIRAETKTQFLCRNLPKEFHDMLKECRSMSFNQQPNYYFYSQNLHKVMYHHHIQDDEIFDWMVQINKKTQQTPQQQRLRLQKISPNLQIQLLPYQTQILKDFYYQYSDDVEVDDITIKYQKQMEKKNINKVDNLYSNWGQSAVSNKVENKKQSKVERKVDRKVEKQKCIIY